MDRYTTEIEVSDLTMLGGKSSPPLAEPGMASANAPPASRQDFQAANRPPPVSSNEKGFSEEEEFPF